MSTKPLVSVMVPIYVPSNKHISMTRKCLDLAKKTTYENVEWVIVETGSDYFIDDADVFVFERNKTTPNDSINRGFKNCSGDYVVFLSNDVFVEENWLHCLLDCFKIEDCGGATLGSNEHNDVKQDTIKEFPYFPIAMVRKEEAWFDSEYKNFWDDTDLIMRIYSKGKKFYKNLNSICKHLNRQTQVPIQQISEEYEECKNHFINKWGQYKDTKIFKRLAYGGEGY